jgi:hypothetical protein
MPTRLSRRSLVKSASASLLLAGVPALRAEEAQRHFDPKPQGWRTFDVTTTVTLKDAKGPSTIWLPVPSLDNGWQRTLDVHWTDNAGKVQLSTDGDTGAKILTATYDAAGGPAQHHPGDPGADAEPRRGLEGQAPKPWSRPSCAAGCSPAS